jgi:D-3-phosphoglycerate dehydrogenase
LIPGVTFCDLNQVELCRDLILITNTHTQLTEIPKSTLDKTRLIIHSNSGYDNFAHDFHLISNIPLIVGHRIRAQAVAEYIINCIFRAISELPQHLAWMKRRTWNRPLIRDQKILLFGFGHIGQIVTSTLLGLGAKVQVVDPFIEGHLHRWQDCEVSNFNIIIVCCGLNKSSHHLFNEDFFSKAHPELIFINGARGKLVKETSLKQFILSHPKAQAFLDVFEQEPFDQSWDSFPQVWKTSHIAGVYSDLDKAIIEFEEQAIMNFLKMDEASFKKFYHRELLQNKWIQGELI